MTAGHRTLVAAAALAAMATAASAQSALRLGARLGVQGSDAFIGGEAITRVGGGRWSFNPNAEWIFVDNGERFSLNADAAYDLRAAAQVDAWAGAGLALIFRDPDRGEGETDLGLNLIFGVGFETRSRVKPYIQGKLVASDDSEGALAFGVRF